MFKKQNLPFEADCYFNVYEGCNVGCKFGCKFNKHTSVPVLNKLDSKKFENKRVLVSYSTEPLPFENCDNTVDILKKLHSVNSSILFLSRHPKRVIKILDKFEKNDIVGVSISETIENDHFSITEFLKKAKALKIKTWLSIEPIMSFEFAEDIIKRYSSLADFLRLGKFDGEVQNSEEWQEIKQKIDKKYSQSNIFVKDCR